MAEPVWALGLMCGTSMDGVDAALVLTNGETIADFGPGAETPLAPEAAPHARAVHADWRAYREGRLPAALAAAGAEVAELHAAAAAALLARSGAETPAIVGFHGQTVAHAPEAGWTWQIGDAAALARALNRPVAWDFRTADVAAGGEGAPLAPLYHAALVRRIGAEGPVAVLNLGGVGNVTWIDPELSPEAPGALLAFDTGPANAPIDDWMRRRAGLARDEDGAAAAAGRVAEDRLARNAPAAFLARRPPKSLDRNAFADLLGALDDLSTEDGAATLAALCARMAAAAADWFPRPASRWWVAGGGRRNPALMAMLADRVAAPVAPVEAAGLDGDLLEAQAFAHLAVRVARGLPLSLPGTTGCAAPTPGGRVVRPPAAPQPPGRARIGAAESPASDIRRAT